MADEKNPPTDDRREWEWNADAYHRLAHPQFTWGQKVLARLPLRGDETVLDAGCGTGRLTAELAERVPGGTVLTVDRSASMLRVAREYLVPRVASRVWFIEADLQALPMREAVDAIFSTATFHWLLDHPRLFRSLHGALKPGGLLLAQCGGGPNLARVRGRASRIMATGTYVPFFRNWTEPCEFADEATTAARLRAAGFVDVETSLEPAPTPLAGAQEYCDFVTAVIFRAHLARLPDEERRAGFIAALTEQAAHDTPPFVLDYWRLNLKGIKPK